VQPRVARRWRWRLKTTLASTISFAHDQGFAAALARGRTRPLVLAYHRVVEDFASAARIGMPSMLTSTDMFERHLDSLARHFRFVTPDEIGAQALSGRPFDEPVAAVTFDDGYQDVYEQAYPVLMRKGIPAAVFLVTDLIGRSVWQVHDRLYHLLGRAFAAWDDPHRELCALLRALDLSPDAITRTHEATRTPLLAVCALLPALSMAEVGRLMQGLEAAVGQGVCDVPRTLGWAEIEVMRRGGITIGSHTRNHVSLPAEPAVTVADELSGSKRALEARLGGSIAHFAYPDGQFTPAVIEAVAQAGYRFAYTACQHRDPDHRALTIERLLLWEGSSVDAAGRFSPAILNCQAHDLWPPLRQCARVHAGPAHAHG
jgi:peptidoglycan/xylan/chitin deacetylase (PgdA/CDA1 family)